ncbi:MAG: ATP-binding cassette domain-containing protein [Propionicimonas sp.]
MIGKELTALEDLEHRVHAADTSHDEEQPFLTATGVGRRGVIAPVDIRIAPGEVVGLAGLLGSGRTEVARLLGGVDRPDSGEITINGQPLKLRSPGWRSSTGWSIPRRTGGPRASLTS